MPVKQTQTKLFDFSDVGLDFCSGSKNLFPDRFKKVLASGYNEKTVAFVTIDGSTVTFTYSGVHNYVANRVLKVNSGALLGINDGEFWIDSVTKNTITTTVENLPEIVDGGFTTCVAPLGWELVYELNHIQIYKFKHIDDTEMYARFCFQNTAGSGRNCIAVGIGRTADLLTGVITDENTYGDLGICQTVADSSANIKWDLTANTTRYYDDFSYNQGLLNFGRGVMTGSVYHFSICGNFFDDPGRGYFYGIFPFVCQHTKLNYPALLAANNGTSSTGTSSGQTSRQRVCVGEYLCLSGNATSNVFSSNFATNSKYPDSIDGFNTTGCFPIQLFTHDELQPIGFMLGVYQVAYGSSGKPSSAISQTPSITTDIDFNNLVVLHGTADSNTISTWLCIPIEEVKIA